MHARRAVIVDAGLYAASALVAIAVWFLADIPIQRTWGLMAVGPYAAGALLAMGLVLYGRTSSSKAQVGIALAVFVGVALLPMSLEVAWRARSDPGLHAQSEVIVTEEAAKALVHGKDPYATNYLSGPLHARPLGTKTHFPYLPGMLLFGLPRALAGSSAATDARVAFAAVTLLLTGVALWRGYGLDSERRWRIAQVFLLLPTGALLMATGGDDLPVLALMLLAVVLAERGHAWGGVAMGLAAAMKQTAWVLVPFLVLALRDGTGRAVWRRGAIAVGSIVAVIVLPFAVWHPAALVEDVVKFPLGLGRQRTAAETPTLGSWLVRTFPSARVPLTAALVGVVAGLAVIVLFRGLRRTPAQAARDAGLVFLLALVLAPAGRIGYVVYPINLLAWSWLLDASRRSPDRSGDGWTEPMTAAGRFGQGARTRPVGWEAP